MSKALKLSTLANDLSAFYQEHKEGIHREMEIGLFEGKHALNNRFTTLTGVTDELVLTNVAMDDFIHQHVPGHTTTFNPTDDAIEPSARILKMRDYEGDLLFVDKEIERTHLMYMTRMKQLEKTDDARKTQTFIEYLFWEHIVAKAKRTLRKAMFQATYSGTTPFSWNKILNGWEKVVADEVVAGSITLGTAGTPNASTIIPKLEEIYDMITDPAIRDADDLVCLLHPDFYRLRSRADAGSLGRQYNFDVKDMKVDGKVPIIEEPDFTDTKIAFVRQSNVYAASFNGDEGSWEFQRDDRTTKFMLNGKIGFQFQSVNHERINMAVAQ